MTVETMPTSALGGPGQPKSQARVPVDTVLELPIDCVERLTRGPKCGACDLDPWSYSKIHEC